MIQDLENLLYCETLKFNQFSLYKRLKSDLIKAYHVEAIKTLASTKRSNSPILSMVAYSPKSWGKPLKTKASNPAVKYRTDFNDCKLRLVKFRLETGCAFWQ